MGHQIIKQPNKKYALWSSVIDDFILLNVTTKEIVEFKNKQERKKLRNEINEIIRKLNKNEKPYYQANI